MAIDVWFDGWTRRKWRLARTRVMQDQNPDLSSLMARYQAGDPAALEEFYRRTRFQVLAYLSSRIRNRSLAEDLLQETFLQVHRSRHTYQPGRPVMPWVVGIARHVMLMHHRSQARRNRVLAESEDGDLPEVPVPAELEGFADRELLQAALRKLPSEQREALVLHYVVGLSYREIGKSLGLLAGTVKLRAFRGIEVLRSILGIAVTDGSGRAKKS